MRIRIRTRNEMNQQRLELTLQTFSTEQAGADFRRFSRVSRVSTTLRALHYNPQHS